MTKGAALQQFFDSFLPAYVTNAVPDDVVLPYLTYDAVFDAEGGAPSLTVNLWFYTTSEAVPNAKAQEISDSIGIGGKLLKFDGGYIWIRRGSPFCQALADKTDKNIKRRYLNITAEFLCQN